MFNQAKPGGKKEQTEKTTDTGGEVGLCYVLFSFVLGFGVEIIWRTGWSLKFLFSSVSSFFEIGIICGGFVCYIVSFLY